MNPSTLQGRREPAEMLPPLAQSMGVGWGIKRVSRVPLSCLGPCATLRVGADSS